MARCQHECLLVRNRCPSYHGVQAGVRGLVVDYSVLQPPRHSTSLLLRNFWAQVWVAADGSVEVLLWVQWS